MRASLTAMIGLMALAACSSGGEQSDTADPEARETESVADPAANDMLTAEGWGPLRIGMSREEVTAAVGGKADPDAMGGPEPEFCEEYQPADTPDGLFVMIEQGTLARVTLVGDTEVRTPESITVGDSADQVRAAYGEELRTMPHTYVDAPGEYLTIWTMGDVGENGTSDENARGIRYEIGENGMVQLIHAGGPAIQYVEGCL
ncbi:MAG: hypothetical protein AAGE05_04475 [Pseudomonadota bacterium]